MDATVTIPGSRDESPSEASLLELPERFEVRGKLGEGAMGTVYRALDRRSGREVAIKVLRHRADPRHQERFLREAQTVAALSHPNVVTVYELDPAGRFLVLELAACTLADEVRERGPLDATRTRRLAAEVLSALVRCHAEGVVHRDIKPSNILLAEDGSARLADFGVAHIAQSDLTQTGEVMGTPIYMAPEQLRGVADAQVDVFGLGAVLYESLTGQPPSEVDPRTIRRTLVKRCGDRNLADAVAQALALDRSHRHPSAAHFARALEPRRAHRRAIAAAVLVGAAALFVLALRADESSSESGSDAEVTSAAARVERPVVALLPFDDRREDGNQHFAASGVPHIVGIELRRADLRTVGYYQLLDRVDDAASPEAWESTARQLGATVAVDGTLSADGDAVRVRMRARVLDGSASAPHSWERTVPTQDVGRGVRELAEALSIWLGSEGQPPALDVSHPEDYALGEGIAALGRHDLASAQAHLERAHELAPTDAEIAYQLAIVGWWRGAEPQRLLAYVHAAAEGPLDELRRESLRGLQLLIERRFTTAIGVYEALLERIPSDPDALYGLFEALFHGGYGERAADVYRRLVEASPRAQLGAPHVESYYLAHADREGLAWLATRSTGHQHLVLPARIAFLERRYGDAVAALERLAEDSSTEGGHAYPMLLLTHAHLLAGNGEGARASIEALSLGADRAILTLAVAIAHGEPAATRDGLRAALEEAVSNEPTYQNWLRVASIDLASASPAVVARDLALLRRHRPEGDLRTELVAVLATRPTDDGAALAALEASPYPVVMRAATAARAELEGQPDAAIESWEQAVARSPDGFLVPLMQLRRARVAGGAGRTSIVAQACDEATHPRVFDYSWPAARVACDELAR